MGLALLLPAYAVGGMGAGDVKLLAGVGAWMWGTITLYAFAVSALVGGVIAVGMVLWTRRLAKAQESVLGDPQRDRHGQRSREAGRDRRRAQAADVPAAVRHSDRDWLDRVLRVDGNAGASSCMRVAERVTRASRCRTRRILSLD